jgi:hypothetical protein
MTMTHMTPRGGPPVAPPARVVTSLQPSLDRNRLREAIAVRRQLLAEREADLVAACEKAVAHGAGRQIRADDRTQPHNLGPRRMEPLRWDCDATRTRVHAGDAPPHQGHRAAGTTRCAPRDVAGSRGMSAVPRNGTNEDMCGTAQAPHRHLSPRVDSRSKPVSVPLPHPRFAVQARAPVMTGEAPSARAASVSPRAPIAHARWEPCAPAPAAVLGGGPSRHRFPLTAPEGTTPARSRRPYREEQLKE